MDNEDILRKAQQEKNDERKEYIKVNAFYIGWLSVSVVMLLLIILRSIYNESTSDIMMILMAQTAAVSFYQYFNLRDKKIYLIAGIISTVAVFISIAALLSQYGVY